MNTATYANVTADLTKEPWRSSLPYKLNCQMNPWIQGLMGHEFLINRPSYILGRSKYLTSSIKEEACAFLRPLRFSKRCCWRFCSLGRYAGGLMRIACGYISGQFTLKCHKNNSAYNKHRTWSARKIGGQNTKQAHHIRSAVYVVGHRTCVGTERHSRPCAKLKVCSGQKTHR